MLRRSRSIAQRTAIALTYAIEAAGSPRPGGVMVSVFFLCAACSLLLVGCGMLVVGLECTLLVLKVRHTH